MKKNIVTILLIFLFGLTAIAAADEPFAPKLKAPSNIKEGSPEYLGVMMINSAVVPSKSAVDVKPYPGALIIQANEGLEMEINGVKHKCYPYIKMLSEYPGISQVCLFAGS